MYFGGHRSGGGVSARHMQQQQQEDAEDENGDNNWAAFAELRDDDDENGCGGGESASQQATAFVQSLLDLQGFCVQSQRQNRQRRRANVENNCVCLLHQILIKVNATWSTRGRGRSSGMCALPFVRSS